MPAKSKKSSSSTPPKAKPKEQVDEISLPARQHMSKLQKISTVVGFFLLIVLVSLVFLRLSYHGRIYPGTRSFGVYLGGLTKTQAQIALADEFAHTKSSPLTITSANQSPVSTSAEQLAATLNSATTAKQALAIGRSGNLAYQIWQQIKYMIGQGQPITADITLGQDQFARLYTQVASQYSTPVQNATFAYQLPSVTISAQKVGNRVDIASLANAVESGLASQASTIASPIGQITPELDTRQLQPLLSQATQVANTKLTLTFNKKSWAVAQADLLGWLNLNVANHPFSQNYLTAYYALPLNPTVTLDETAVSAYVGSLASQINTQAVDAQLSVTDGRATVFAPSKDGATLNVPGSTQAIVNALTQGQSSDKTVPLVVAIQKAAIRDDTITQLGITDLLSEGVTYFPGSSKNRLNNIRVGQSRFQGVLIKPDETFSFGKQMGPVGPEQGYLPGLVILNGHEENQYGGGMCQVSSTLFRAALLAGLPIVERHNHAFAVSFYTAPYGVPGVDATIYYPGVDLKIKNDTGHYILIQTEMTGTTLKFRLYGTKTKEGVIRGPSFIDGSNDATKPSTTVFYRDVLTNGQVIKTDTFTTHYQSSLDFPISTD